MKNISFIQFSSLFFALALIAFSCKKDVDSVEPTDPTIIQNISDIATFHSTADETSDRLTLLNETIILSDTTLERDACTKYSAWTKVAEVSTLLGNNGQVMSATHVSQTGDIVAVTYHTRGADYEGVVEVWDISNPKLPKYKGGVAFQDADINAVVLEANPVGDERLMWLAMADQRKGAMVAELKLKSNNKFDENHLRVSQLTKAVAGEAAASANAIVERDDYVFVTAGKSNGGVFTLSKETLEVVTAKSFPNAKGVAIGSYNKVAAVQTSGSGGIYSNAHNLEANPPQLDKFYGTSPISHQNVADAENGKVSAAFSTREPNFLFVASGDQGVKAYDLSGNNLVYTTPQSYLRNGNANGIAFDQDYMYVANGADGIAIFPMNGSLPDESSVFLWDMDEVEASANFISADNGWVVIAKGEGGFKLLKKATPGDKLPICNTDLDGVPGCMSNDVTVCGTLVDRLNALMPLDSEVEANLPGVFSEGFHEIHLIEDTNLKITFVEENTDLQNSIGYYFYHDECPPASVADLVGMVAFANYSGVGSDGALETGNTIKLPGTFKAGTRVGFFLVRNGFNGSNTIYYSNADFNADSKAHCLLFSDDECGDIIGAFQGNPMPSTDADFRDGTFKITPSNPAAILPDHYVRL